MDPNTSLSHSRFKIQRDRLDFLSLARVDPMVQLQSPISPTSELTSSEELCANYFDQN